MLTYDIIAPTLPDDVRPAVHAVLEELDLDMLAAGWSLATYPGSQHWHIKQGKRPGMLEVTHWPQEGRLWVSVHENRDGGWAMKSCPAFANALAARIGGRARKRRA